MTLQDVLNRLDNVKGSGQQFSARCPAHDDNQNSLSIGIGNNGQALMHCHAGCEYNNIVAALPTKTNKSLPTPKKLIATYDYVDPDGKLLYQKVRYHPKGFCQRRPDKNGEWIYNLHGVTPTLYCLPEVITAVKEKRRIFIVEGEKDVESLREQGEVATCNTHGAGPGKWFTSYNEYLAGADIVILSDNDKIGLAFSHEIATSLSKIANHVRLIDSLNGIITSIKGEGNRMDENQNIKDVTELFETADELGISRVSVMETLNEKIESLPLYDSSSANNEEMVRTRHNVTSAKQSQSDILLKHVEAIGITTFHDELKVPYIAFTQNGSMETYPVNSSHVESMLKLMFYEVTERAIQSDSLKQVLGVLEAKALRNEMIPLNVRVTSHDRAFWYDLTDPKWRAVRITANSVQIIDIPPILFRRYNHQQKQVVPQMDGDIQRLLRYINIKENQTLFLCWLVACFVPNIPHAMLILHGVQGAAKSTACSLLKKLVDPSALDTVALQKDSRSFVVTCQQHWLLTIDNLSYISGDVSDALCRAITGGGIQQRKLYTDADDTIFKFQRCIAINGINNVATRPDLLDRSILIELKGIPEKERRSLAELYEEFENDCPFILGGIFNILSKAMAILPNVKLNSLTRMADFAKWGYAIGEALGGRGQEFFDQYTTNRSKQHEEAIDADSVATLIVELMREHTEWDGYVSTLYNDLIAIAEKRNIDTGNRHFPNSPALLGKHLKKVQINLAAVGISYDKRHTVNGNMIYLKKE